MCVKCVKVLNNCVEVMPGVFQARPGVVKLMLMICQHLTDHKLMCPRLVICMDESTVMFVSPSVCLSVCPTLYLSVCVSVCLSVRLDVKTLSLDRVEILLRVSPNEQEVKAFKEYERERKPIDVLSDVRITASTFFLALHRHTLSDNALTVI